MRTIPFRISTLCSLAALLLVAGCGQPAAKVTPDQLKAFAIAPVEVKEAWEKALAADKADDYVAAVAALDSLKTMHLSEQQVQALGVERAAFGERLMKAVQKNDPAAIQAFKNSQKSRAR